MGAFSNNANNVPENDEHSSFRVLGIAMVVDQRGKEARTVMRYPTSATTISSSSSSTTTDGNQDLFYKLPGRQMAKLFRPKPALCGQPMTLSIGGTIFCCCAVLMEDDNSSNNNNDTGTAGYQSDDDTKDNLVLFSVIVALAPQVRTSTMGIGGWMEAQAAGAGGGSSRNSQEEEQHKPHQAGQSPMDMLQGKMSAPTQGRASESFLSIRRVHVSLGRLCRVLEREERRCRYVSVQANLFDQIRHDLSSSKGNNNEKYSYWQHQQSNQFNQHHSEDQHNHSPKNTKKATPSTTTSSTVGGNTSTTASANAVASPPSLPPPAPVATPPPTSPASLVSSTSKAGTKGSAVPPPPPPPPNRQHRRAGSNFTVSFEREITVAAKTTPSEQEKLEEKSRLQELEQVIMETMMAVVIVEHQGNLARELVQVYHAMGRNSHDFPPTPAILLSGREGVVYINRHIAIAIEPVSSGTPTTTPDQSSSSNSGSGFALRRRPVVRPYHTLLFPDASPSQLLESMAATTASRSVAPRRLQQLLRMVSPQKSLTDIAVDTNLPLPTTLDIAAYLVGQGACRASPVLSRKIRLASHHGGTARIRRAALAFSQDFGTAVNLFGLVGFLTEPVVGGRNLGDAMTLLTTSNEENIVWLRECFLSCLTARNNRGTGSLSSQELAAGGAGSAAAVVQGRIDAFADHHPVGGGAGADDHRVVLPNADDIEELLYQMVVWLCSHEVLVQLQDYLLAKLPAAGDGSVADSARTIDENESMHQELGENNPRYHTQHYAERKSDSTLRLDLLSDDLLVQELLDSDCCTGKVTVQACCWKTGMDPIKLYQLVARCPKQLRLVTRVPYPGDDWEGEADE